MDNLRKSNMWNIQLTIANNFISSTDNDEEHAIHSKSNNKEIIINDQAHEVIENVFESLKNRYQNNLEPTKGNEFVFDYILLLHYKRRKTNPIGGGSYIDSPDWIKKQKSNNKTYQQKG